jgi:hypothetical protein
MLNILHKALKLQTTIKNSKKLHLLFTRKILFQKSIIFRNQQVAGSNPAISSIILTPTLVGVSIFLSLYRFEPSAPDDYPLGVPKKI